MHYTVQEFIRMAVELFLVSQINVMIRMRHFTRDAIGDKGLHPYILAIWNRAMAA